MKRRRRNLSTNKTLTAKINPTPTSVPTTLTNQVEELANINKQTRQQTPQLECREYQQVTQKRNLMRKTGKSACYDSGATMHAMKPGDDYIPTDIQLDKVFEIPDGKYLYGSTKDLLHHEVREPARTADVVPGLALNLSLSASKFADAKYVTVLTPDKVLIFDDLRDLKLAITQESILKIWRCKTTGLWRVPLAPVMHDEKEDTILLDRPSPKQAINSAYKFPSTEQLIQYLNACAGYPTKETWVKAIRAGNYVSWPGLAVKNINKYYPETDETPKVHMRQVLQSVRSTR